MSSGQSVVSVWNLSGLNPIDEVVAANMNASPVVQEKRSMCNRTLRYLALVIGVLLLTACSRLEFAYSQADWYLARWAADYLSLEREQRDWIKGELKTYRTFHREARVPRIRAALQAIIEDLESGRLDRAKLDAHTGEVYDQLDAMTRDLLPLVSEVLASLSSDQREALEAQFEERRAEAREELRDREASDGSVERVASVIERAESWVGDLRSAQEEQLGRCVERMPDTRERQLAWEIDRQDALLAQLGAGASAERIREFLTGWWLEARGQPAELREARERRREITLDCLAEFLPTLDERQQDRLTDRLSDYVEDLDGILEN